MRRKKNSDRLPTQDDPRMHPTIMARDVYKSYGSGQRRTPILHGISLEIGRGETVFLVGPSGSGKTTLLSLLGCILTPDRGRVRVLGQEVGGLPADQLTRFRRNHLGFVFQSFNLFPTLSALDNIRMSLCIRGASYKDARGRAAGLLEQVGLGHRMQLPPGQLSLGECQRVAIARALANEPAVLLADEPTASLDAENGQAVLQLLSRLTHDRGVTLVIVTHDNRIFPFADRILHLEDGYLTDERSPAESASLPIDHRPFRRRVAEEFIA
jgi:putative ABC transport system ATP-binding protein